MAVDAISIATPKQMNIDEEIKKVERKLAALKARSLRAAARRKKTALSRVMETVKRFGFETIHELLEVADTAAISTSHLPKRRRRTKVDDKLRKSIIAMLKTGETVAMVAGKYMVSTATVNNIKKAAGLTKSKKAKKTTSKKSVKKKLRAMKASKTPAAEPIPIASLTE